MEKIYGTDARIGLIYIASSWIMEPEFNLMASEGICTCTTRVSLGDSVTAENLIRLGDRTCDAAALLSESPMDVIALGCTSGSFIGGDEYDLKLISQMEVSAGGVKCTTTGRSVIKALKHMHIRNPAVLTPYTEDINRLCLRYLEANQISPVHIEGMSLTSDHEISSITLSELRERILSLRGLDQCDGIFISCTGLKTVPLIDEIEALCGKPVITSVQATFWNCLRICGIDKYSSGPGSLFKLRAEYNI